MRTFLVALAFACWTTNGYSEWKAASNFLGSEKPEEDVVASSRALENAIFWDKLTNKLSWIAVPNFLLSANPEGAVASTRALESAKDWDKLIIKSPSTLSGPCVVTSESHSTNHKFDVIMHAYPGFQILQTRNCWSLRLKLPEKVQDNQSMITDYLSAFLGRKISIQWSSNDARTATGGFTFLDAQQEILPSMPRGSKPGDLSAGEAYQLKNPGWQPGWQREMRIEADDGSVFIFTVKQGWLSANNPPTLEPDQNIVWWNLNNGP